MNEIEAQAELILKELDHFATNFQVQGVTPSVYAMQLPLLREPFIAYVKAERDGQVEHQFVCRFETPHCYSPSNDKILFVSYKTDIGRLAVLDAGQSKTVRVPGTTRLDLPVNTVIRVLERNKYESVKADGEWDARNNEISLLNASHRIESLRAYLAGNVQPVGRRFVERMELRDQAILDAQQDDISRLAINKTLLITGAPGTGKTTVLIKRLSRMTKPQFLDDTEKAGLTNAQQEFLFADERAWVLFSPSSLLKSYLKEALSRELLPAFDQRVVVWEDMKKRILRDDLRFLRVSDGGFFTMAAGSILKNNRSRTLAEWTAEFVANIPKFHQADVQEAVKSFDLKVHGSLRWLRNEIARLVHEAEAIRQATANESEAAQREAKSRGTPLDTIATDLRQLCSIAEQIIGLAESHAGSTGLLAWAVEQCDSVADRLSVYEQRALPELSPEVISATRTLRSELKNITVRFTRDAALSRLADYYQRFRTFGSRRDFFNQAGQAQIDERKLDRQELDTLLYAALRMARESFDELAASLPAGNSAFARLVRNFRTVVAIDEAADFSAVELACMRLIAHPRFDSVSIAGDPMQRLTDTGIHRLDELAMLLPMPEPSELKVSYRQSARLLKVASDLYQHAQGQEAAFTSVHDGDGMTDPVTLVANTPTDESTAQWLAERILEIHRACERLPSIAVLVPDESHVRAIEQKLRPLMDERGIDTTACYGGETLGTEARVRIFDIKYIKGLEFEAVFFASIDKIARQEPHLVDKYLYVGLTRARSFLGVTYSQDFPQSLTCVRAHFQTSDWRGLQ